MTHVNLQPQPGEDASNFEGEGTLHETPGEGVAFEWQRLATDSLTLLDPAVEEGAVCEVLGCIHRQRCQWLARGSVGMVTLGYMRAQEPSSGLSNQVTNLP